MRVRVKRDGGFRIAREGASGRRSGETSKSPRKSDLKEPKPETPEVPEGLAKKYFAKSTFNTQDIMRSLVEKTLKMLDKILSGERLFTM